MSELISTSEFWKANDLIVTPVIIASEQEIHLHFNKAFQLELGYTLVDVPDMSMWFETAYPEAQYRGQV